MTEHRSAAWLQEKHGKPNKAPTIRRPDGTWVFVEKPRNEQDVIDGCLYTARWYGWQPLKDAKGSMLWYRTSEGRKSRLSPGTPDYHFVDIRGHVRPVEFKFKTKRISDRQQHLVDAGISTIIGPDDLMKFMKLLKGASDES